MPYYYGAKKKWWTHITYTIPEFNNHNDQLIHKLVIIIVRRNVTIDWTERENVRAKLRLMVKKILRKYGYPSDKQEKATITVLEQAKLLGYEWVS